MFVYNAIQDIISNQENVKRLAYYVKHPHRWAHVSLAIQDTPSQNQDNV